MLSFAPAHAQCTFISPTVELNFVQTDINGNCVVNFNLGFEIDINNGNKIIFVHLWRTADYQDFNYATQTQPKETDVLADALATIIIDNQYLLDNPGAPASQVFKTMYGPDPGIDDNSGPAQAQVKDASDGLTYNQVIVNAPENIFRYTIHNLQVTLPGACAAQISFTGDAWSSNGNSASSSVQCTMEGYSFIVNDPTITSSYFCHNGGFPNQYQVDIATTTPLELQFVYDVYGDNGDGFFDQALDQLLLSDAGPFTITSGSPYSSGLVNVPAPYGTLDPFRQRSLWVRVEQMKLINNNSNPPVITNISNLLLDEVVNPGCVPLPVTLSSFSIRENNCMAVLNWTTASEHDSKAFVVQKSNDGRSWSDVGSVAAAGYSSTPRSYAFTDPAPGSQACQYRLKQAFIGEETSYSKTVAFQSKCDEPMLLLFPNPTRDKITVTVQGQGTQQLYVYNASGSQVARMSGQSGQAMTLNMAQWPSGIYQALVFNNGKLIGTRRFVKN